jgi:hypothetical protein
MSQPLLEQKGGLATKRANATAIALESLADWGIGATYVITSVRALCWPISVE